MIATFLATSCREAESLLSRARFSRQISRQNVVSDDIPNQKIPTKCRDSSATRRGDSKSRQLSRHFGGKIDEDAEQAANPAIYPARKAGFDFPLPGHFVRLRQHHTA